MARYNPTVVYGDPELIRKHLAGHPSASLDSGVIGQSLSGLGMFNPSAWTSIKAAEQQWLLQRRVDTMQLAEAVTQSLSQVPEIRPVFQSPEWWQGILDVSQTVGSYFAQISSMVERVADNMAVPLAGVVQLGEQLVRPVQGWQQLVGNIPSVWNFEGFWEGLQPILKDFQILLEDAEAGREVLKASEFGFADHFWGIFYIRGFADIDPRVRNSVVTNKLFSYTRSEVFVEQLRNAVEGSKLLHKRWGVIESALEAHATSRHELAVPALLAQIEGSLVNLMFLKDLVKRDKNDGKFYLVDENGDYKLNKKRKRLGAVTLKPAITNAKLDEHPNLGAASEFVADTLVQRRNAVLHGRDLSYGKRKFSIQALLILAVLVTAVSQMESGNITLSSLP